MGAPDSPVRQPRHPTVRVLTVSTVGALTAWVTGQSDAYRTCTVHCLVRLLAPLYVNCPRTVQLSVDRCAGGCCSAGTPDSPVNYSGARPQNPEGEEFEVDSPWCTGHCPVVHRTVGCTRPGFSSVSFAPFF
jgi:hypothetical protein